MVKRRGVRVGSWLCALILFSCIMSGGANALSVRDPAYNGQWQDYGNGWQYMYYTTGDFAVWKSSAGYRFKYEYTPGQWYQFGTYSTAWNAIGGTGVGQSFIGDGARYYDLKNGWWYYYYKPSDKSQWYDSNSYSVRFAYTHSNGQWYERGDKDGNFWSTMGTLYETGEFVGGGNWRLLKNNWYYKYEKDGDVGHWYSKQAGAERFIYSYTTARWWDRSAYDSTWNRIGGEYLSAGFIGDGKAHDLKNGWWYTYQANDMAWWKDGMFTRFGFQYNTGQWWSNGTYDRNWWSRIGSSGLGSSFVGDYKDLKNGWVFYYSATADSSFWYDKRWSEGTPQQRFQYNYLTGQWFDYRPQLYDWGRLGLYGYCSDFIGDGALHQFGKNDWFQYNTVSYVWSVGTNAMYAFNYLTNTWYKRIADYLNGDIYTSYWYSLNNSSAYDFDVRYLGYNHLFVESYRDEDPGLNAPSNSFNIYYNAYRGVENQVPTPGIMNHNSYFVTDWTINDPGGDRRWSGGNLNVLFLHTDFCRGFAEYSVEDTVVFIKDMTSVGFSNLVDWMGIVTLYYSKPIYTAGFIAHGNSTGWNIGEWVSTSNYTDYEADFRRMGSYMATDGQIVSYHCSVGYATNMLNAVAQWTGADVYANTPDVYAAYWLVNTAYDKCSSSDWKYNYKDMYISFEDFSPDMVFEYTSSGAPLYHKILDYYFWNWT